MQSILFRRLDMSADKVKAVYVAASRLRMEHAAESCASFLLEHMDTSNCLELRSLPGVSRLSNLVCGVDAFIEANIDEIAVSRELLVIQKPPD